MNHDWQRVRELFERALEVAPEQRAAWLDANAGVDGALRREIEELLAAESADDKFLEPPTIARAAHPAAAAQLRPPERLGAFRLLEPIGSGGMGTVWLAEQERPQRRVAVKVVHGVRTAERNARFHVEVEALARLQHPGIAQVLEAGLEADGTAWFAMELLDGAHPLQESLRDERDLAQLLGAFLLVCDAIQHAHQRGVIHRDLKPGNILRLPDGRVKVIDFGIARVLDQEVTARTADGALLGTLAYMSPEQVEGRSIDVRTDVYGLGVVLYELLAGRRPFDLDDLPITAACRLIVERDPTPLRKLAPQLPAELEWIVGRTLQKDPSARYASVADLADDLRRLLHHEPVRAAPPGAGYLVRKFVRRHRVGVAAAAIVLAVSLGAFVTTAIALVRAQHAEAAERDRRVELEQSNRRATAALDFLLKVFEQVHPGEQGRDVKMVDALARTAATFATELAAAPTIRAALGRAIGVAFFSLGKLEEAEQHFTESLATAEQCHGPDHAATVQVRLDLCQVLVLRGRLDEAERQLARAEQAFATDATLVDDDRLHTTALVRRADLQRVRGDRDAAIAILTPVVERLRAEHPDERNTWLVANLLAGALQEGGQADAAEPLYRAAIDGFRRIGDEDHPAALAATNNLLMVLYARGQKEQMVPMLERLVEVRSRVLGPAHPDTIGTLSNLGGLLYRLDRTAEAVTIFRRAVDALGPDADDHDRIVQTLLSNLTKAETMIGEYDAAQLHGERVLRSRREVFGDDHEATLMTAVMIADLHRCAGRHDDAARMFADVAQRAAACTPPQVLNGYRATYGLARVELARGAREAAERQLLRCLELYTAAEQASPEKGQLGRAEPLLAELYRAWGKPEQAARYEPGDDR